MFDLNEQFSRDAIMKAQTRFGHLRDYGEEMSFEDLYRQFLSHYPIGSHAWVEFMKIMREYQVNVCPMEYVLCLPKQKIYPYKGDFDFFSHFGLFDDQMRAFADTYKDNNALIKPSFSYKARCSAEWNPGFVHFIVGGLIHTADDKYVILKRKRKNWVGKYTTVMGHVTYGPDVEGDFYSMMFNDLSEIDVLRFVRLLMKNLIRELREEVCYPGELDDIDCTAMRYEPPRFITPADIQYYHAGFIFLVNSKANASEFKAGEPEKNDVVVMTKAELQDLTYSDTDGWLYNAIQKFL